MRSTLFRPQALAAQRPTLMGAVLATQRQPARLFGFLSRRQPTPLVLQTEAAECGLACLAMVAGHHGDHTDLGTLRRRQPVSAKGATLMQLMQVAARLGLSARPVKAEVEDLARLPWPAVLHWDFEHFVVLVSVAGGRALIHDPARGACQMPLAEVSRHFTGVCLELRPDAAFKPKRAARPVSVLDLFGRLQGVRGAIARILLMAAALELFAVLSPLFMQLVVDRAVAQADRPLLAALGLGFLLLVALQVAVTAARAWAVMVLSTRLNMQAIADLYAHLLRLPMAFFEKRHLGDIASRFDSMSAIQRTLTTSFIEALVDGSMALITLAVMFGYSAPLAGVVLLAAALYALVRLVLYRPLRQAQDEQMAHAARQQSSFLETVRGMQSVKLFNRQLQRSALYTKLLADNFNAGVRMQRLGIAQQAAHGALFGIENVAVIWMGAAQILDGTLSLGMLFAFIAFKLQFASRTAAFVDKAIDFRMLGLHAERVGDITTASPENAVAQVDVGTLDASIELRDVSFAYSEFEPPLLSKLNLRIEAGESVAIVGPSGCGKTTLLKLILGLLQPTEGQVLMGGVDIATLGVAYRDVVGAVMQHDELFAGSIAHNISFFDLDNDQGRVEGCARAAAIDADIQTMPMAYHTLIADMGSTLSGGQKQRVLLARALYKQPRILVLDEATSHLDASRERSVNVAVQALSLTRISVAHRAETIASAGRVIAPWADSPQCAQHLASESTGNGLRCAAGPDSPPQRLQHPPGLSSMEKVTS